MNFSSSKLKPVLLCVFLLLFLLAFVYQMDATKHLGIIRFQADKDDLELDSRCMSPKNVSLTKLNSMLKLGLQCRP